MIQLGRRRLVLAAITLSAIAVALLAYRRFFLPPPPLEVSFWYWHQPFRLPDEEMVQLKGMGVRRLFVRAGTFHRDSNSVRLTMPQQWRSRADGIDIHLVFNFDASIVHAFEKTPNTSLAGALNPEITRIRGEAERAGLHVTGVQLDLDCPTSQLVKYAELLHIVRSSLVSPRLALSITALPTWYGSPKLDAVLHEIDFAAPQYYESNIGRIRSEYTTVSQPARAERGLAAAGWRGAPFFAGAPVYGHALVYDSAGKLVGAYHDMGVCEAIRSPAFRLEKSFAADGSGHPAAPTTYIGEDVYELKALAGTRDGRGAGFHVVYDVPTPASAELTLSLLRRKRPSNCQGLIFFRYPVPGEAANLPLGAIAGAFRGQPVKPDLSVELRAGAVPWETIDSGSPPSVPATDIAVVATNTGRSGTFIARDAISVTLALNRSGLSGISVRGSDTVETFSHPHGEASAEAPALRSSSGRANVVRLRRIYLAAGETQTLATLRIPAGGATRVQGRWSVRCPGGFEILSGAVTEWRARGQ